MGPGFVGAFHRMETVEHTAKIYMNIQMIGNGCELSEKELEELYSLRNITKISRRKKRVR